MANRKNSLGARIKYAREESGLSQKELAGKIKLSDKTVSSYEVDRAEPSFDVLKKIGKAVNRPVRYFVDDRAEVDVDLAAKLEKIEQELSEVKRILAGAASSAEK